MRCHIPQSDNLAATFVARLIEHHASTALEQMPVLPLCDGKK